MTQAGDRQTGEQLFKKGSAGVNSKLSTSQQCVLTAKMTSDVLGCTNRSTYSRLREAINPFYLALIRILTLEYCVQFWASHYNKDIDELE